MELSKLLEKKFITLEELEEIEESIDVQEVQNCGMSGNYIGKHWYNIVLIDGQESAVYTD